MKLVEQKKNTSVVQVGKVYKDCDPRMDGRRIRVISIETAHAMCENLSTGRKTKIGLGNFHTNPKNRSGFVLEQTTTPPKTVMCLGTEDDS